MLSFYLTEEVFLKGLNLYLTRHSYANATSDVRRSHQQAEKLGL